MRRTLLLTLLIALTTSPALFAQINENAFQNNTYPTPTSPRLPTSASNGLNPATQKLGTSLTAQPKVGQEVGSTDGANNLPPAAPMGATQTGGLTNNSNLLPGVATINQSAANSSTSSMIQANAPVLAAEQLASYTAYLQNPAFRTSIAQTYNLFLEYVRPCKPVTVTIPTLVPGESVRYEVLGFTGASCSVAAFVSMPSLTGMPSNNGLSFNCAFTPQTVNNLTSMNLNSILSNPQMLYLFIATRAEMLKQECVMNNAQPS